jgi:deoxyribonuclease V
MHRWDLEPAEARKLQNELASQIRTDISCENPGLVAGVDVAYRKSTGESVAVACLHEMSSLKLIEYAFAIMKSPFPYIPGLLSFREIPPILEAIRKLSCQPDLFFVDGHGRAHPRRLGIASHLGLWLKKPSIGIGKSRLCGKFEAPGAEKGQLSSLTDKGEEIGKVVRTRAGVKPVFVSVGFGLALDRCVELTFDVTPRFRLPEPIRTADKLADQIKRNR